MIYDLESRLINFSVRIIHLVNNLPQNAVGLNLASQLSKSGTSVSLHYGEAQSAESRKDFIHKMKILLKELRETNICLQVIEKANLIGSKRELDLLQKENVELIAIFVRSIQTARKHDTMQSE